MKTNSLHFSKAVRAAFVALLIAVAGLTSVFAQEGALNGIFTVNENGGKVLFSQGNLQYQASTNTWRFAENQCDYVGDDNTNISETYSGWIDLFCWGTSGYNHGANCYQPWSTSIEVQDFFAYGSDSYNLYDQTGQADWGYNAIGNGGNVENSGWRTLTHEEWTYLFFTRSTNSGKRYAKACVNDVNGVILLPDDWNTDYYALTKTNTSTVSYTTNVITTEGWASLEQHGAVFLPAAGTRYGTSLDGIGTAGRYFSTSYYNSYAAWSLYFDDSTLYTDGAGNRESGFSVRLVRSFQVNSFEINATPSPAEGGSVSGIGTYQQGESCTLTATPTGYYYFVNWTENGEEVSTDSEYTFLVTGDRTLEAHFALPTYSVAATANPSEGGIVSFPGLSDSFDFEDHSFQGWTTIDADGDGYNWRINTTWNSSPLGHNGSSDFVMSESYTNNVGPLYPDNYLVSPRIILGGNIVFYACTQDSDWAAEHFGVAVSTSSNNNASDFTLLQEWTMTAKSIGEPTDATRSGNRGGQGSWYQYTVDLSAYAGQIGYVAIRHFNCTDMWHLNVDDITLNSAESVYEHGQTCFIKAVPNYGYAFENWKESNDVVCTSSEYTFTVTGNRNLVANFTKIPFAINVVPNFQDRGTVSGAGEYVIDETCILTAIPNSGHNFVYWMENGQAVSTETTYSFTVNGPRDLVAVFSANVDDIIVFADPNVKAICVANWDTDGDAEITYAEAAAVTNLNGKFSGNRSIAAFDELQYFTGLTYLNNYEFYYCENLASIVLPGNLSSVGDEAFYYCYSLTGELTIGENVGYIGWGAFYYTNFEALHYNAVNCEMGGQWLGQATNSLTTLTIGEQVEVIPYGAFQDCYNVTGALVIPNSVSYIGALAFNGCSGLQAITIPDGIANIEEGTFGWCDGLESVSFPSALESVGNYAFYGCNSLASLDLPNTVTYIAYEAFENCSSITGVLELPASLTYIGGEAFMGCAGLSGLVLPENIQTIGYYAFKDCSGLRGELTLPEALETVGGMAFSGCDGLTTVNYNAIHCTEMGNTSEPVFNDCAIEHINIGTNVQSIPNFAFRRCSLVTDMHVATLNPPTICASTFGMVPRSIPVMVPAGTGDTYRNAQYWEEFFNIMEDGEQYSFYWDVDAHQYAHNLSVIGIIQINGVEQSSPALEIGAFCGNECRGRQLLTTYPDLNRSLVFLTVFGEEGDLITFRLYDHETEEESSLACATVLTFEADAIVGSYSDPEVLNFVEMQNTALEAGWTWFCAYVDAESGNLLQMMEEGLGENGVMIKSQADGFVSYDEYGWDGTLATLNLESMYMVNTSAPAVVSLSGAFANAAEHPITLSPEWNWIGYPSYKAASINNALASFDAQDGDVIKMQEAFAQYVEGAGWMGALKTLVPGAGLMYHSLNGAETTLTYAVGAKEVALEKNLTSEDNHWTTNRNAYPFNMSVVAVVELDGLEAADSRYELAAFDGDECRGSVRLMYVEAIERYMAFLTVSGHGDTKLSWALYDAETGETYRADAAGFRFEQNAVFGSVKEPVMVRFANLTGAVEALNTVSCYPNPVGRSQYVRVNIPAARVEARVDIVNTLGAVVSSRQVNSPTVEVKVPAIAGIYVMRVTIGGKNVGYTKLIVD